MRKSSLTSPIPWRRSALASPADLTGEARIDPDGPRNPVPSRSPAKYDRAGGDGSDHRAPDSGFLPQASDGDGASGPERRSGDGFTGRAGRKGETLGRQVKSKNLIGFQGARGAFSEEAARKLLGPNVEVLPCDRFEDIF